MKFRQIIHLEIESQAYNQDALEIKWAAIFRTMLKEFGPRIKVEHAIAELEESPTEVSEHEKPGEHTNGI